MDERESNHQDTPRRKLMEKMRQIKKDRLRPMNAFGKSAGELVHDNFIIEFGHGEDASDHPKQKYRERRNPRPPPRPGVAASAEFAADQLAGDKPRKNKHVNDRPLHQHRAGQ